MALYEGKKAVCTPLSKRIRIGFVPPDAWGRNELCKRPLSWYWASSRVGMILVISSFDLEPYGLLPQIRLRDSKFRPKVLPDESVKQKMISGAAYKKAKPRQWEDIDSEDPSVQEKWLKIMGIRGVTYKELFISHCANHANFIDPSYFIYENGEKVPYSIGKTNYICSACMELYNIIGADFRKKLVVPCPGGVLFAGLPVNRYIEVETVRNV